MYGGNIYLFVITIPALQDIEQRSYLNYIMHWGFHELLQFVAFSHVIYQGFFVVVYGLFGQSKNSWGISIPPVPACPTHLCGHNSPWI